MLHVQNKYEECSKHYQDTLTKLPEPTPNATHKALEEVCWYVFILLHLPTERTVEKKRLFIQPNDWTSLNINSSIPFCHFQLFSRVHFMHGAHRLVNIWYTLSVFFIIVAVSLIFQDFYSILFTFNFTILRFFHIRFLFAPFLQWGTLVVRKRPILRATFWIEYHFRWCE